MAQQIILRRGTSAAWDAAGSVVLAAGEPGFETNTGKFKIGNGVTAWSALAYAVGTIPTDISNLTDTTNLIPENLGDLLDVSATAPTAGQVLKWDGTQWLPSTDATTGGGEGATYTVSAETATGGANLRLTGSDASTDDVKFAAGTGITVDRTDDGTITIASTVTDTDTNTTYAISAGTEAGGANVVLTAGGSGTGAQNLFLKAGTGITISDTTSSIIQIDATGGSVGSGLRYGIPFYAANGTALSALPDSQVSYNTDTSRLLVKGQISLQTTAGVPLGGLQTGVDTISLTGVGSLVLSAPIGISLNTAGSTTVQSSNTTISGTALAINAAVATIGVPDLRASLTLIDAGTGITGGSNPLTMRSHSNVAAYTSAITLQKIKGASYNTPDAITTGDVIAAVRFSSFDGVTTTTNITNVSRLLGVATYTVDAAHGLPVGTSGPIGWVVSITCSDATFSVVHATVISVPNTTTFTIANAGIAVLSTSATGTVASRNFDVRAGAVRVEAAGTIASGIIPGSMRLMVANSTGALVTGLLVSSTQAVSVNGTFAINGVSSGLRIGSTNGAGGALVSAVGTSVDLPAGSTIAGVAIGSIKVLGTKANNTALNAVVGMVAGDAYVLLDVTPYHLWSYTGSAWVDIGAFQGAAGTNGTNGTDGQGVVTGGTSGQVLAKIDGTNYNTQWISLSAVATSGNYSDIAGKPTDLSQFTDSTSLIPADVSDLTDSTNLIPATLTDLGIVDGSAGQVLTTDGAGAFTFTTVASGGASNSFSTIAVAGQTSVAADSATDTLTLVAGTGVSITTNDGTDTITIASTITDTNTTYGISAETATGGVNLRLTGSDSATDNVKLTAGTNITLTRTSADEITIAAAGGGGTASNSFSTIAVAGQTSVAADSATDTLTLVAGTNITITTNDGTDTITINASGGGASALDDLTDVVITGTPTNGQVLKYDTGTSKWVNGTDAGGSSLPTRATLSGATSSIADGAVGPINITGYKSYMLMRVETSAAAWVRIYVSEAARIADASRLEGTDPLPGAGVIAEVITTGAQTVLISPGTLGFNNESTVTTNIPVRVTNKSGAEAAITVTLTALQLEA
jgi:hypothetical protein